MKTTTKYITKLIVSKPFTYEGYTGEKVTIKAGRVLETVKHRTSHYYPWNHHIVLGHGLGEVIPVENLKVKWFEEIKTVKTLKSGTTTSIKIKEVKVK